MCAWTARSIFIHLRVHAPKNISKNLIFGLFTQAANKTQNKNYLRIAHKVSDDNHSRLALRERPARSTSVHLLNHDFWALYASRERKLKISASFAKHTMCLTTITRGLLCARRPLEVYSYIFVSPHAKIAPKIDFRFFTQAAKRI